LAPAEEATGLRDRLQRLARLLPTSHSTVLGIATVFVVSLSTVDATAQAQLTADDAKHTAGGHA
jgi:hypothetical protein